MVDRWITLPIVRAPQAGQPDLTSESLVVRSADVVYLREEVGRVRVRIRGTQEFLVLACTLGEAISILDPPAADGEALMGLTEFQPKPRKAVAAK